MHTGRLFGADTPPGSAAIIASIYRAHDATLLTRNLVDFVKVPGLKVENWLD